MQVGMGVTAIWNDVLPEARADFLAWHMREHMAERVALPGFRRGRRHVALDATTQPAFFTLYEAESLDVLTGHDYTNRLNGPTPWTQRVMATLRSTTRVLARVEQSQGTGLGGVMLTLRFAGTQDASAAAPLLAGIAERPGIAGVHRCATDAPASGTETAEQRAREGDATLPAWFILVEAADAAPLAGLLPDAAFTAAGIATPQRGLYRLEFLRDKSDPEV